MAQLFQLTPAQWHDLSGLPQGFAQMWFTIADTDTPVTVYEDPDGTIAHENPVVSDATGLWPPIYVPDGTALRVRVDTQGGTFANPAWEIEYTPPSDQAAQYDIGTTGATIPLNNGHNVVSGNRQVTGNNTYSGSNTHNGTEDLSGATVALPITAAVGASGPRVGFRDIPLTTKNEAYGFLIGDAGKGFVKDDTSAYSYTIPPNSSVAFPIGTVIQVINEGSAGAVTIVRGSGVTLRLAGVATNDDWDIAAYGEATIEKTGTDRWVIRGTGVST